MTKEEYDQHDCHLSLKDSCATCETWFEEEFCRKYENGDFDDRMILDDDLPDTQDNYVVEMISKKERELEKNATDRPKTV